MSAMNPDSETRDYHLRIRRQSDRQKASRADMKDSRASAHGIRFDRGMA